MTWSEKPFLTLSDLEKLPKPQRDSLLKRQGHIWKWDVQSNRLLNTRHADNRHADIPAWAKQQPDLDDPFGARGERLYRPKAGQSFHVYQRTENDWDKRSGWLQMPVVQWNAFTVFVEHPDTFEEIELMRSMLKKHGYDMGKSTKVWFYTAKGMEEVIKSEDKVQEMLAAARANREALAAMAFALNQGERAILPIPAGADRATIMRTFRQRAKLHHPDHGGSADDFRRLCEAKDKALAAARP